MKLFIVVTLLLVIGGALASISQLNLNPTGNFAKLTSKQGLWVSIIILKLMLLGELGFFPYKFQGRKKRAAVSGIMPGLEDTSTVLKVLFILIHRKKLSKLSSYSRSFPLAADSRFGSQKLSLALFVRIGGHQNRIDSKQRPAGLRHGNEPDPLENRQVSRLNLLILYLLTNIFIDFNCF